MHKRYWALIIMVTVLLIGAGSAIKILSKRRAAKERQAVYSAIVKRYSDAIKPGMSRLEVEANLQLQHRAFRQMCCVNVPRSAFADLVKIGQEDAPWFCNHHNIYVAFEFETTQPHGLVLDARDSDKLEAIRLFPWLEECL